jgi:hypothetical protein
MIVIYNGYLKRATAIFPNCDQDIKASFYNWKKGRYTITPLHRFGKDHSAAYLFLSSAGYT